MRNTTIFNMPRKTVIYSMVFHVLIVVVSYLGLPALKKPLTMSETPVMVELVTVAERTNAPPPPPRKPAPQKKPSPPREAPPTPPQAQTPPPPPPSPLSQDVAAVPPAPTPKPKKAKEKPKPQPKAKPEPEPKVKVPPKLAKAKPKRKPKPPDNFASVLKTLEELDRSAPKKDEKKEKQKKKQPDKKFDEMIAQALMSQKPQHDPTRPLTISEIDLVRQQIARCWNLPAGAKNAEDLIIEIKVGMNPDGTVREARIENQVRMSDGFFRAAAESALRAVLNPQCQPFKLPPEKYSIWQTMTLTFNPKEMFGV
ncbi:MAG: hypothetical protein RIB59_04635 [Rhodospirillales bacterium]